MATLAEELEKWKRNHPELANKGMISVADPNAPEPRPGLVTSSTLKSPEFRKGEARTSFLEKIGARYMENTGAQAMTWQEKTGMQLYDPAAQKRFSFRQALKKSAEAPYRTQAMRHAKLAEIIGTDIATKRKAEVDIATGLMSAEAAKERTGVIEEERLGTAKHRAALERFQAEGLDISRAGLESLTTAREATAVYQKGMLGVAETTRPGSLESQVARLQLQMEKDISDVIQKEGAPEGILDKAQRKWYRADAPNEAMKQIMAIQEQYDKIVKELRGVGKAVKGVKVPKDAKAPSYEKVVQTYKVIGQTPPTREEWEELLASEEGKKRYPGGR